MTVSSTAPVDEAAREALRKRHLHLALGAMQRGWLTPETVGRALLELGASLELPELLAFWTRAHLLDPSQLALLTAGEDTRDLSARPTVTLQLPQSAPSARSDARRYRPLRVLGVGGMGRVDECLDTELGRHVARKQLIPGLPDADGAGALLAEEARITGRLEHPNIIPIYDLGFDTHLGHYYVMRMAQQETLGHVLSRLGTGEKRALADFSQQRLLRIFLQVCHAVSYAHSQGIGHRDLKPSNILLGSYGEVLVVDWGIAGRLGELPAFVGGTPGYLAPECLLPGYKLEPRADVFSLGAVLYELLCLKPAFDPKTARSHIETGDANAELPEVMPPETREPPWPVHQDLSELCLRALARDPEERLRTPRELASAIDDFLDGARDRERRAARASALVESGDQLAESYRELLAERPRHLDGIEELRARVAPWDSPEQKQELWDAEDSLAVLDNLASRTLQTVLSTYEQALDESPGFPAARAGLARVYELELRRARERRDDFDRVHFEERLRQVGEERSERSLLTLLTATPQLHATLVSCEEQQRRLVPGDSVHLPRPPFGNLSLPPGSYLLHLEAPGRARAQLPLSLHAGEECCLEVDLPDASQLSEEEVLIAGGPALLGSLDELHELRELSLESFVVERRPVSFRRYLRWLEDLARDSYERARERLPLHDNEQPLLVLEGGRITPTPTLSRVAGGTNVLALPVVGVRHGDAESFARWEAARTGRPLRLPTAHEWEKAARGVDGRIFPWGDRFDPTFCLMRETLGARPRLLPSGSAPSDCSPYGVLDLAGGVADWVHTEGPTDGPRPHHSRGGSWLDGREDCRAASRRAYGADDRSLRVGFRLARVAPWALSVQVLRS